MLHLCHKQERRQQIQDSMKPKNSQFSEADYDFSGVKEGDELTACYWYEYARESRAAINEVAALREQRKQANGKSVTVKYSPRVRNHFESNLVTHLSMVSGFPDTPWQSLSDTDRQNLLKLVAALPWLWRHVNTWHNPPLTLSKNEPGTMTLDMWKEQLRERLPQRPDGEPIKFGFFAINLKYAKPILIEEFKDQLKRFDGKPLGKR